MNITESFAQYLQDNSVATLGQNFFIGRALSSDKVPDSIFWVIASGGDKVNSLISGEAVKVYRIDLYFRHRDYRTIYETLQKLEEDLNCDRCSPLDGYETMDIEASTFPIDQDLDSEDRLVGLLQANIRVYKDCP